MKAVWSELSDFMFEYQSRTGAGMHSAFLGFHYLLLDAEKVVGGVVGGERSSWR